MLSYKYQGIFLIITHNFFIENPPHKFQTQKNHQKISQKTSLPLSHVFLPRTLNFHYSNLLPSLSKPLTPIFITTILAIYFKKPYTTFFSIITILIFHITNYDPPFKSQQIPLNTFNPCFTLFGLFKILFKILSHFTLINCLLSIFISCLWFIMTY